MGPWNGGKGVVLASRLSTDAHGKAGKSQQSVGFNDKKVIKCVALSLFPCFTYQINSVRCFMLISCSGFLTFFFGWTKDKFEA